MKKIIFMLCLVLLVSCATTYNPPAEKAITKTKSYQYDYDYVWDKIIEWFGKNGTPIKNLDKNSGFISTESNLSTMNSKYMDCGEGGEAFDYVATLNIIVKRDNNLVNITINSFFSCLVYNRFGVVVNQRMPCYSTGLLEQEIFGYIEK
jgi:hypothetical protein